MKNYKLLGFFLLLTFLITGVFGETYNQKGDFTIEVNTLRANVFNDNIEYTYKIEITNNLNSAQDIFLDIPRKDGWDINIEKTSISLSPKKSVSLNLYVKANKDFDYGASVVSPDLLIISQKNSYEGSSDFPVTFIGKNQEVSLKFIIFVEKKDNKERYIAQIASQEVSPISQLGFTIEAQNLYESQNVEILLEFAGISKKFEDRFSEQNNFKVYQQAIPSTIVPGTYDAKLTIRAFKSEGIVWEWKSQKEIQVVEYNNLYVNESIDKGFFKDEYIIELKNLGNVDSSFQREFNLSLINRLFFDSDNSYEKTKTGVLFTTVIPKGESTQITFSLNYLPLYIILIVIVILGIYIYVRKTSNPLDIEINIYEVRRVTHEGVKSMKVKIGFENIKEHTIDNLSVIFRMPGYLAVKDNTFLLTEPNHVLKGKNQYKLVWDFRKFEQNDSRILGFVLVNSRGVLGDIKIPDLEIEVKSKGKIRKYYKSLPIIKG